jgi:hypothetical protein
MSLEYTFHVCRDEIKQLKFHRIIHDISHLEGKYIISTIYFDIKNVEKLPGHQ